MMCEFLHIFQSTKFHKPTEDQYVAQLRAQLFLICCVPPPGTVLLPVSTRVLQVGGWGTLVPTECLFSYP